MRFEKSEITGVVFHCIKCVKFHNIGEMDSIYDNKEKALWCGVCLKQEIKRVLPHDKKWKKVWKALMKRIKEKAEKKTKVERKFGDGKYLIEYIADDFNEPINHFDEDTRL